ncbi:S-(hydroxymethyl)glutathione dehydrogenase (EC [Olavius sp. associated proteobacterium Delta 1]|nr:S-(hydroxymethyl)glutathione dehydrogenase (EC [Olavius sp. associated proteobacterium Delta 1]
MKAAVMTQFREPVEIQNLSDPAPGPNDALIEVKGCGVCRSDWHAWQEDWSWVGIKIDLPHILGHEISGVVREVGKNVRKFKPGDRVTMAFHTACGQCHYCYGGHSNLCQTGHGAIGFQFNGGYGHLVVMPAADVNLVQLPDAVDFISAAALGCRFMTAYHGLVDRAVVRPGEWVAIFGLGGIGLSAVQIASTLGAQVIAVDISENKLEMAKTEGAAATLNALEQKPTEAILDLTKGGADLSVDALGLSQTALPALSSLRRGGRHLQIGLTGKAEKGKIALPVDAIVLQEISFIGTFGCPTTRYPSLLTLVANGKLKPKSLVTNTIPVENVNAVLSSMTDFATVGFQVINSW